MGIVTDKLNEIYGRDKQAENVFALQEITKVVYQSVVTAISNGSLHYPTGDQQFDDFFQPIVSDLAQLRSTLEGNLNQEFINWTKPQGL